MHIKWTGQLAAIPTVCLVLAATQTQAQWQLTDAPGRTLDKTESVIATDGYALVGINKGTVGVYDLASGVLIRNIHLPTGPPLERRTFAAEGGRLLISDSVWAPNPIRGHSRAYAYDIATGRQLAELALPAPTVRLGVGGSLATDGELGLVSSIRCIALCDTQYPTLRGIVDVFRIETGEHLIEVTSPDDDVFAQGLDIDNNVIAVSSRSHELDKPGRVHLVDATSGATLRTIVPSVGGNAALRHNFGFDLALDGDTLVVGDNADLSGHGMLGDGKGLVDVYDIRSGEKLAAFTAASAGLQGTPQFGHSVDISGDYIIVGAPANGSRVSVTKPSVVEGTWACPTTFSTGGPCFEPAAIVDHAEPNTAEGAMVIANFSTGGIVSRATWTGGESVSIDDTFVVVQSLTDGQTSTYAVSLAGLLPGTNEISAATRQTQGDLNGNGSIGFDDFLVLSDSFGNSVEGLGHGDLNSNGEVDFPDFLILSEHFGTDFSVATTATVPEPVSLSWFGILLTLAMKVHFDRAAGRRLGKELSEKH